MKGHGGEVLERIRRLRGVGHCGSRCSGFLGYECGMQSFVFW